MAASDSEKVGKDSLSLCLSLSFPLREQLVVWFWWGQNSPPGPGTHALISQCVFTSPWCVESAHSNGRPDVASSIPNPSRKLKYEMPEDHSADG